MNGRGIRSRYALAPGSSLASPRSTISGYRLSNLNRNTGSTSGPGQRPSAPRVRRASGAGVGRVEQQTPDLLRGKPTGTAYVQRADDLLRQARIMRVNERWLTED